jgi:hypothetical protein
MSYECPKCRHQFNDQTVYCENWREKEKCFGCPNCKQFFYKVHVGQVKYMDYLPALLISIFVAVLLFFSLPNTPWARFINMFLPVIMVSVWTARLSRKIKLELKMVNDEAQT